jgi:Cu/Ag efflux pump CusA
LPQDWGQAIETAVGGKAATEIIESQMRVEVKVRFPEERRNSAEAIGNILVATPGGGSVPLAELAEIIETEGPVQISRDNAHRSIVAKAGTPAAWWPTASGCCRPCGAELIRSFLAFPKRIIPRR